MVDQQLLQDCGILPSAVTVHVPAQLVDQLVKNLYFANVKDNILGYAIFKVKKERRKKYMNSIGKRRQEEKIGNR